MEAFFGEGRGGGGGGTPLLSAQHGRTIRSYFYRVELRNNIYPCFTTDDEGESKYEYFWRGGGGGRADVRLTRSGATRR